MPHNPGGERLGIAPPVLSDLREIFAHVSLCSDLSDSPTPVRTPSADRKPNSHQDQTPNAMMPGRINRIPTNAILASESMLAASEVNINRPHTQPSATNTIWVRRMLFSSGMKTMSSRVSHLVCFPLAGRPITPISQYKNSAYLLRRFTIRTHRPLSLNSTSSMNACIKTNPRPFDCDDSSRSFPN